MPLPQVIQAAGVEFHEVSVAHMEALAWVDGRSKCAPR